MVYNQQFDHQDGRAPVTAGIIGTGHFSTAIIAQSALMPGLEVNVAADVDVSRVRQAYAQAGFPADQLAVCDSRSDAMDALQRGKVVALTDPLLMMDLPVDVVVEATGSAEAGAAHALEAIRHGKHVAMVNKETDAVVGPILKHLADRAGVVYTAVEGDQHGLLIGMVSWARSIGLEVLCAGKVTDGGTVYDGSTNSLDHYGTAIRLDEEDLRSFESVDRACLSRRAAVLGDSSSIALHDYEETVIMANGTGLVPDIERLHHPVLRSSEIPEVLCPREDGGVLEGRGIIDVVVELRDVRSVSMAGGVFAVVTSKSEYSRSLLTEKGHATNARRTATLIHRPYHLCGVEAPTSIMRAALAKMPTGAVDYSSRYDIVGRARRTLEPGTVLEERDIFASLLPAMPASGASPLPVRMAVGRKLERSIEEGEPVTADAIAAPTDSAMWSLRAQQDAHFLAAMHAALHSAAPVA